jgi:hypothetical protein
LRHRSMVFKHSNRFRRSSHYTQRHSDAEDMLNTKLTPGKNSTFRPINPCEGHIKWIKVRCYKPTERRSREKRDQTKSSQIGTSNQILEGEGCVVKTHRLCCSDKRGARPLLPCIKPTTIVPIPSACKTFEVCSTWEWSCDPHRNQKAWFSLPD